jgi:germination protein M
MRAVRGVTLLGAVLLAALAVAGCDESDNTSGETTRVLVYLLRDDEIGAAARQVAVDEGVERAAVEELLTGPSDAESQNVLGTAIPEETTLNDVGIEDGVATVDLSEEFDDGGGSAGMFMRLAQVVFTLTQFPSVTGVQFELDGEPVETFSSEGIVLDGPQDRADFEDQSPAILVETPAVGDVVTSPLQLRGTANTFEANFEYEVLAPDGSKLAGTFVTASCGTGCRGTFDEQVAFDAGDAGEITLVVLERSEQDGSRTNEVSIPLDLAT